MNVIIVINIVILILIVFIVTIDRIDAIATMVAENAEFFKICWNCMTNGQTGHQFGKQTILPTLWHVFA